MAEKPNLLMCMKIIGNHIETWIRSESEWADKYTDALLDVVLGNRFRNALFQRIIEGSELRDETLTRINNRQTSLS